MITDLVSVVITTFNRIEFLEETLYSIQNQNYPYVEVLVIDDGSESKFADVNKKIVSNFSKCTYYFKENTGQPDSRNYGIARSNGEFIAFCDDDDCWEINKLVKQIEIFNLHPDLSIVTGCIEYISENGQKTGIIKCHEGHNHGYIFETLLEKNRTASITPLLRRKVFTKVGFFNPNFRIAEDWEFWRRVSYYYKFYSIDSVIAYVRLHPENMSKSRSGSLIERYQLYRKLTITILAWGEGRFQETDYNLIYSKEWQHYKNIFRNNPSFLKKIEILLNIFYFDLAGGFHLIWLIVKYELLKCK